MKKKKSKNTLKNIKSLIGYTSGQRLLLALGFAVLICELLLSFVSPLVLSVTVDSILGDEPLTVPSYFAWYINAIGGIENIRSKLWLMSLTMLGIAVISGALSFLRPCLINKSAEGTAKNLRDKLYGHMQRLPFAYHVNAQTGDLIQRATNDIDTVRRFLSGTFLEFVRTILLLIVGLFVMLSMNVQLTVICFSLAPLLVIDSLWFFGKIQKMTEDYEEQEGKVFTVIQENITGTRVVRAFGRQRFELDKMDDQNENLRKKHLRLCDMFAKLWTSLDIICGLQIALVTVFGVYLAVRGTITLGQYTAFMSYTFIFLWPIRNFGRVLTQLGRSMVAVGRIEEIMDEKAEDPVEQGQKPDLKGDIKFNNIDFSYEGQHVLKDLNLTMPGGKTIAILGATGSGKSTLVQLLQRLYDPEGGSITIGGVDIRDINLHHLRSRIGIVLQEPYLYSKTILQNIGIKMLEPDRDRVIEAARTASVHDDIIDFELGYDTIVGERGVTLSGGQKQRVAIARTLIYDSDILIFDDSLSAVDTRTDARIRDALSERRKDVTTIIISHRITTLMEADLIIVMQNGQIAEQGSHRELMNKGGIYSRIAHIQSDFEEVGA